MNLIASRLAKNGIAENHYKRVGKFKNQSLAFYIKKATIVMKKAKVMFTAILAVAIVGGAIAAKHRTGTELCQAPSNETCTSGTADESASYDGTHLDFYYVLATDGTDCTTLTCSNKGSNSKIVTK